MFWPGRLSLSGAAFPSLRAGGWWVGKGDEFPLLATGGGELVEVPLMQALGAGRRGERFLPFACLCMVGSTGAGSVQYFCHQGKTGNGAEGQGQPILLLQEQPGGISLLHRAWEQKNLVSPSFTQSPSQCHLGLGRCDRLQEHFEWHFRGLPGSSWMCCPTSEEGFLPVDSELVAALWVEGRWHW